MFFKKTRPLLLLAFLAACSTGPQQVADTSTPAYRDVAALEAADKSGIMWPAERYFQMSKEQGQTYAKVLKEKIKPALDSLSAKSAKNVNGGGFDHVGSGPFKKEKANLWNKTLKSYMCGKWNRTTKQYDRCINEDQVATTYETLMEIKTDRNGISRSTVESISYFDKDDKNWPAKNDMVQALKAAGINGDNFNLATLYALTAGLGVKVKIDDNNYNYHVLYKTGFTDPHQEVMSGRSFASGPGRGAADATDPEYLKDLQKYLHETNDQRPFYRAMILALADTNPSGWPKVSHEGQAILGDFLTVYTAEAVRHLMVNLKYGVHPWEIDLAAVTVVSSVSEETGYVVQGGVKVKDDIGAWFAPSKNNKPGGPQRSGIGITRKDRQIFQKAIHNYQAKQADGKVLIARISKLLGKSSSKDVIQDVFEYLSNPKTPDSMGPKAEELADAVAEFVALAKEDGAEIVKTLK